MNKTVRIALVALLCVGAAACSKKQEVKPQPRRAGAAPARPRPPSPTASTPRPIWTPTPACVSASCTSISTRPRSSRNSSRSWRATPSTCRIARPRSIRLEGNTDERGTREYNLGLGERRGNAVSSALQAAGGSASQLNVVSYGKEKPVCREHNEDCWSKNRRVEIVYTAQ